MQEVTGHNSVNETITEDNVLYNKTTFFDDESLKQNQRIRESNILDKAKLALHDGEDVRMAFSIPSSLQYTLFQKDHPEVYKLLMSADETERMSGARQMAILKPSWVCYSRI